MVAYVLCEYADTQVSEYSEKINAVTGFVQEKTLHQIETAIANGICVVGDRLQEAEHRRCFPLRKFPR